MLLFIETPLIKNHSIQTLYIITRSKGYEPKYKNMKVFIFNGFIFIDFSESRVFYCFSRAEHIAWHVAYNGAMQL